MIGNEYSLSTDFPPYLSADLQAALLFVIGAMVSTLNPSYHNVFMVVLPEI